MGQGCSILRAVIPANCLRMRNPSTSIHDRCGVHLPRAAALVLDALDRLLIKKISTPPARHKTNCRALFLINFNSELFHPEPHGGQGNDMKCVRRACGLAATLISIFVLSTASAQTTAFDGVYAGVSITGVGVSRC